VSKFHSILCLIAQESRLRRKGLVLNKNCAQFLEDRTCLSRFSDKSGIVPGELVRVWGGLVQVGIFSLIFDNYFERNLLTVSLIDPILLSLTS
jgi:hypothetical protein